MIWQKSKRSDSSVLQRHRSLTLQAALELVKVANRAERESAGGGSPLDTTTSQDLANAHDVVMAEKELTKRILLACDLGMTPVQVGSEIINTTIARTVVGDLALFAMRRSVHDAERQRNLGDNHGTLPD